MDTTISLFLLAFFSLAFLAYPMAAIQLSPQELASQYSLTTSTTFPFPTATQSSSGTDSFIVSQWSLSRGRLENGPNDVAFVDDPFTNNSSSSVLEVTYPEGSFSHDTGGTQFYNLWNTSNGDVFQSLMLSYDIAFDNGFDWVKGGKLPGLRGGPNATGCSGGNQPTGSDCFSVRLMWRQEGAAEVYAYIPTPNNLCSERSITCNDDFGTSISRGAFSFVAGEWSQVTLLVQLNSPADVANGNLKLYYNNVEVISQTDLQFRSSSSVNAGGMYFSTFFGGSDDSWATPSTTHTYFRNITMWGGSNASNLTGAEVTSAASGSWISQLWTTAFTVLLTVSSLCM
ncbi:polysaccharide lyase family 14 protein [Armillaria novae-zelandiae]|uniref:Polysaccharide lyase family 14 protein n=1 Tax=Armillaria novae-zelandiae TaxID=153914 RepID=A0AA39PLP3_9AGAR|nr:polysaccharide lyase family 14 protein [Armillaria novae-zelandiae]